MTTLTLSPASPTLRPPSPYDPNATGPLSPRAALLSGLRTGGPRSPSLSQQGFAELQGDSTPAAPASPQGGSKINALAKEFTPGSYASPKQQVAQLNEEPAHPTSPPPAVNEQAAQSPTSPAGSQHSSPTFDAQYAAALMQSQQQLIQLAQQQEQEEDVMIAIEEQMATLQMQELLTRQSLSNVVAIASSKPGSLSPQNAPLENWANANGITRANARGQQQQLQLDLVRLQALQMQHQQQYQHANQQRLMLAQAQLQAERQAAILLMAGEQQQQQLQSPVNEAQTQLQMNLLNRQYHQQQDLAQQMMMQEAQARYAAAAEFALLAQQQQQMQTQPRKVSNNSTSSKGSPASPGVAGISWRAKTGTPTSNSAFQRLASSPTIVLSEAGKDPSSDESSTETAHSALFAAMNGEGNNGSESPTSSASSSVVEEDKPAIAGNVRQLMAAARADREKSRYGDLSPRRPSPVLSPPGGAMTPSASWNGSNSVIQPTRQPRGPPTHLVHELGNANFGARKMLLAAAA